MCRCCVAQSQWYQHGASNVLHTANMYHQSAGDVSDTEGSMSGVQGMFHTVVLSGIISVPVPAPSTQMCHTSTANLQLITTDLSAFWRHLNLPGCGTCQQARHSGQFHRFTAIAELHSSKIRFPSANHAVQTCPPPPPKSNKRYRQAVWNVRPPRILDT